MTLLFYYIVFLHLSVPQLHLKCLNQSTLSGNHNLRSYTLGLTANAGCLALFTTKGIRLHNRWKSTANAFPPMKEIFRMSRVVKKRLVYKCPYSTHSKGDLWKTNKTSTFWDNKETEWNCTLLRTLDVLRTMTKQSMHAGRSNYDPGT